MATSLWTVSSTEAQTPAQRVTIYEPEKSFGGYTLFCHTYEDPRQTPDGVAHLYLIDMAGEIVHEWTTQTAVQLLERKWSRVIELDPLTEEIVWSYEGSPRESFFSAYISGAQPLPNGNVFICEGGRGRLFEVTRC